MTRCMRLGQRYGGGTDTDGVRWGWLRTEQVANDLSRRIGLPSKLAVRILSLVDTNQSAAAHVKGSVLHARLRAEGDRLHPQKA